MNRLFDAFQQNEQRTTFAAQIIVLLMMLCVNILCVMAAGWMSPKFYSQGVITFGFLVTVEALYSCRLIKSRPADENRKLYYRLTEWIVILLLLKVFTEIRFGFGFFIQNVISWSRSFSESFFTVNYLFNIILALILWISTTLFSLDLMKFEDDINYIRGNLDKDDDQRKSASASFRERFLAIGALIVLIGGIMRYGIFSMSGKLPPPETIVVLVIAYFLLGMVLLSLAHFANLRASWGYEQYSIHKNMASHWILYCSIFLGLLVLVVMFLPTNYSMGLFTTLRFLFTWLFIILKYLFLIFLYPFFWIF